MGWRRDESRLYKVSRYKWLIPKINYPICIDADLSRLEKQHYQFFPIFARFYNAINLLQ